MALQLILNVDDPGDLLDGYGVGAKLVVERDTASAFATPTEVGSLAIDPNKSQYELWDGSGSDEHWYRSRYSDTANSKFSRWSDPFQGGTQRAYASINALRELLQLPDDSRDNLLSDLLVRVTDKINVSLGFDFLRHPVSGTETRLYDGPGMRSLTVQKGIASLETVRLYTGSAYETLPLTDYRLRMPVQDGGPYLSLDITGRYSSWYHGYDTVELTGVFGYPSVPPSIEMATLYWAADLYRIGAYGGSQFGASLATGVGVGLEEFGQSRFAGGMPRITWETVEDFRKRHQLWLVA